MKKLFKHTLLAAAALLALAGCNKEDFEHPSEAGIPDATTIEPVIVVDQQTNTATFSLPAGTKALIPLWYFEAKDDWSAYSAQDGLKKLFTTAGDYKVRMKLMNSNGVSPNYVEKTFHIDNTIFNFDKYNAFLTGGSEKTWRIDNSASGHMGCGESGTTGTNWWSANPDDKKDWGVYDNRMTFATEGNEYTFDPGDHGTIYVNKDINDDPYGPYNTLDGNDYNYPVSAQSTTWSWEVEGENLFLVLPAKTLWPYYPNVEFIANPRLRVENIDAKTMNLVADNGSIAWHFTLTSGAAAVTFNGFKYNGESNLWKPADAAHSYSFYYAPGWSQIADPEVKNEGNKYVISLPTATSDQWQAQFFIIPDDPIAVSADKTYDFSVILNSSTDGKATVKFTDASDDGNFLFAETVSLKAFEDYIFYVSDKSFSVGGAEAVKMVFDFGGCPDNTEVTISNIVLKDHANDDGTVLPSDDEPVVDPSAPAEYAYDAQTNLWKPADDDHSYYLFYAPNWAEIDNSNMVSCSGNEYTVNLPTATSNQWQAQVHIIPTVDIPLEGAKSYDFSVVLSSSVDMEGVTLKLTDAANDGNFLFTERVDLKAFEEQIVDFSDRQLLVGDAAAVKMVFDFGGCPDNAEVTLKRIVLKDHSVADGTHGGAATPDAPGLNTGGTQIWDNSKVSYVWWYSASDWSGQLNPVITEIANGWKVVIPEGIGGSEWQGQTHFTLEAPISASKTYDFAIVLNSSADCTCTVKVAWEGHDSDPDGELHYNGNVSLTAYNDFEYISGTVTPKADYDKVALFVDLGRTPVGAEVEIKNIRLYEH